MSRRSNNSNTGESRLRERIERLQRALDLELVRKAQLDKAIDRVITGLVEQLPANLALSDGQYQYLIDCLVAKIRAHVRELKEARTKA